MNKHYMEIEVSGQKIDMSMYNIDDIIDITSEQTTIRWSYSINTKTLTFFEKMENVKNVKIYYLSNILDRDLKLKQILK